MTCQGPPGCPAWQRVKDNEPEEIATGLLVPAHSIQKTLPAVPAVRDGQAKALQDGAVPVCVSIGQTPDTSRQLGGEHHSHGDGGAVTP